MGTPPPADTSEFDPNEVRRSNKRGVESVAFTSPNEGKGDDDLDVSSK
jgi:hypothetical protein